MKNLIIEQVKNVLNESAMHDKHDLHNIINTGHSSYSSDHDHMKSSDRPFDDKFRGDMDKVVGIHEKLSKSHNLKHIIAKHFGDNVGAKLHKNAAMAHRVAHKTLDAGYHEDGEADSWNKAQYRHEKAMDASVAADAHDKNS